MEKNKYLFISTEELYWRDGGQVKLSNSIVGLRKLVGSNFKLVTVSNSDKEKEVVKVYISPILETQNIVFENHFIIRKKDDGSLFEAEVLIAFKKLLAQQSIDMKKSFFIGSEKYNDVAEIINIKHLITGKKETGGWDRMNLLQFNGYIK